MQEVKLISREELLKFFADHNNRFVNKHNVVFNFRKPGRIIMSYELEVTEKERYSLLLQSKYKILQNFISDNQIQSPDDLQQISKSELWLKYLCSKGTVVCHIKETDSEVLFTVTKAGRTSVASKYSRFRGVVSTALSMPEQFEEYVKANWYELTTWVVNRHRIIEMQ